MDEYEVLTEIIRSCLWIDGKACATYRKFAENTQNGKLKQEWLDRADEEKTHMHFWKEALVLGKQKHLPLIFKDLPEVKEKITGIRETIEKVISQFTKYDVYTEQMMLALMLESCMLHPAFMIMFHDYRFINNDIDRDYENHVKMFVEMVKTFKEDMSMLQVDLFCENLYGLYQVTINYLYNSLRDTLTGLYNRRGFINGTSPVLSLAERDALTVGIIIMDFDDFKLINDSRGHLSGDTALKTEAEIINSCVRKSDIVGRYGGDEFIIFAQTDKLDVLKNICERIRKTTEE
ncbi:MAG: diguanylate cyclase, partial [Victivallales bacterium]|nr:diguanylate cyclase [Victivallales bacterium]